MALVVAEFFELIGLDMTMPSDMEQLIPYLLTFFVGVVLVSGVFHVIGKLAELFINFRRW